MVAFDHFQKIVFILATMNSAVPALAEDGGFSGLTSEADMYGHARLDDVFYDFNERAIGGERCKGRVLGDIADSFLNTVSEKSAATLKMKKELIFDLAKPGKITGTLEISRVNTYLSSKREKLRAYSYTLERTRYRGVDAAQLTIKKFADKPITFIFAKDPFFRFSFPSWVRCPMLSWFPEVVYFLAIPGSENEAAAWIKRNKGLLVSTVPSRPEPENFAASNEFYIETELGREMEVIDSLMNERWVMDASLRAYPYGPPFTVLNLRKPIFTERTKLVDDSESKVRKRIAELLPRMAADAISVTRESRTPRMTVDLEGRAADILPRSRKYSGYWLKAKIDLAIYAAGTSSDHYIESMIVSVSDGYLAKWPNTASNKPEQKHVTQFHLKEDGPDDFSNFNVLIELQTLLTEGLSKSLHADIAE